MKEVRKSAIIPYRFLFCAVCGLLALPLSGTTITVFSTGLDNSGSFLPGGSVDPHWTMTLGGSTAYVAVGATQAEHDAYNVPVGWPLIPDWWTTSSLAQWIAPIADVTSIKGSGEYDFQTTFTLAGLLPGTAEIKGNWTADNATLGIFLNGVLVPNTTTTDLGGYKYLTSFDIKSGFVPGLNTLSFHVQNSAVGNTYPDPNPTGLIVEITGTAAPVPEPGTMIAAGVGLALVVWAYRRRNKLHR